ncbi:DinB family protein [Dyadobacter sp. NIV53]|uniref:DinB family protein n=1 Tax=Dyadobacter sp. NIV53 TaxID=2861765 RepID=UPI001C868170|nr:DinB family protein [Dyadobacter sp. NIV53]
MVIIEPIERLQYLYGAIPPLLQQISEEEFAFKPTPTIWSKKEILGHLIDSATNNHQRFVRIQYENEPVIFYDQNQWNILSNYNQLDTNHLINFWAIYNQHIIDIIKVIPSENLQRNGMGKDGQNFPLHFYINDYVSHLEHHLRQILAY